MSVLDSRERVCVIGLDGMPHSLLTNLIDQGVMPGLKNILSCPGTKNHKMRVTIPEISSVSWTSFATGVNPGIHGIYGFIDFKPDSYQTRFPDFRDCRAKTIWHKVGGAGGRSVVINQPFTWPAAPLKGHLISGFVSPLLEKAVFPRSLVAALKRQKYQVDIDTEACRRDHELLWKQLFSTLKNRITLANMLWNENWNYFQLVFTGTDRLFHYLWQACIDQNHHYFTRAMEYFAALDRYLASVYERFTGGRDGNKTENFFLLSDHGFCALKKEVNINTWLAREGFLSFTSGAPGSLEDIDPASKAFCLDPGRIYINRKSRFPAGSVEDADAARIADQIKVGLEALEHNGSPVMRQVLAREEVYAGPLAPQAPDLVGLAHPGFDLKGRVGSHSVFTDSDLQGMHTWDDAFLVSAVPMPAPLMIWDVADVMLNSLNIG